MATEQQGLPENALEVLKQENAALRRELDLAREQLRDADSLMLRAFQDAPLPYHSLDGEGRILHVSQGWLELFGYVREEVRGRPFIDFAAPECHEAMRANFARLKETGRISGFEAQGLRKDGRRFAFSVEGMALPSLRDGTLRSYCLLRDISAEKAASALLEKSERFYRAIFDKASVPIALTRGLTCFYANRAMAEALRMPGPEALVGAGVMAFLPTSGPVDYAERNRRREAGEPVPTQYETVVRRADGTTFPAYAFVSLVELPDGPATIGYFMDFTRQKKIADSLVESETRFRKLFDEVPAIAVQGYAHDREVIYWNAASEALYGYTAEEALGRKLEELIIPPDMRPAVIESIRAWTEDGVVIPSGELWLMRKDGSLVHVFSCHVMQRISEDRFELYCLDVDMTRLDAAHEELTRARDAAESANKAKSEFLANMSHEIRTPLNGVLGMLQLLLDGALAGTQHEYASLAYQSSHRLLDLLNDILDFSRIESGALTLVSRPFRMEALAESVLQLFRHAAEGRGLSLELDLAPEARAPLLGDEARLRQILFNLVGNAIKFTRAGGVRVEAWVRPDARKNAPPDGRLAYFCVCDSGVGIPESKIPLVFERFTQTDGSYTRQFEGAGLGLAIVKRIAELMGGSIVMDSEPGQGTSICVCVPLLDAGGAGLFRGRSGELPEAEDRGLSVLLVEDDRVSQMYMLELLTRLGHSATLADNGVAAVELLGRSSFDCVLMDVQMPGMDGLEATRLIRQMDGEAGRPATHIVAMTAYALSGDREKFLAAGMDDYVGKPVQIPDLLQALKRVPATRGA